jgi:hypothetical protein
MSSAAGPVPTWSTTWPSRVRAAELLGGARPLCDRLQVPMPELTRWLAGDGKPSIGIFLRVIDVLLEERRKPRLHPLHPESEKAAE